MKTYSNNPDDLWEGTQADTLAPPADFPLEYNYASGKITDPKLENLMYKKMPLPLRDETVLNTKPDTSKIQALYLWEKGKAPARTKFTKNMTGYFDDYDFRPFVT